MAESDWDRTVASLRTTTPPAPVEIVMWWTLTKGRRTAEAWVRPHPAGQELTFLYNGEFLWSEVFVDPVMASLLGEITEAKRREFLERDWSPHE